MAASGGYPASAGQGSDYANQSPNQMYNNEAHPPGAKYSNQNGMSPPVNGGHWGYNQDDIEASNNIDRARDLAVTAPSARDDAVGLNQPAGDPSAGHSRGPSGSKTCGKCGESLAGQFVRALGDTYHLECFTCHDCGKIVASKFFPVPDEGGPNQYPLCETDYFRRLDLLCHKCGGALRGSYITALDQKYHIEHFTCSVCPTVFGAQDSYYEHEGMVYCHYHYSTKFAQRCNGCQNSILKQFVEIFRNGQNQHWHPECYMIHKYWNVRLSPGDQKQPDEVLSEEDATDEVRQKVKTDEEDVEDKVLWIWKTLSTFEERSATCISDMLLQVSNAAYADGVVAAKKFIVHVELLFEAADDLDRLLSMQTSKGLSYQREAKLLCKKVVAFFKLLSESSETGVRRLGVTQELLSLVTGLAHYLKLLIRICLQGALKLERETQSIEGLHRFLDKANMLDQRLEQESRFDPFVESQQYIHRNSDTCPICQKAVEDKCVTAGDKVFHYTCMLCQNCGTKLEESIPTIRWSSSKQKLLCRDCAAQFPDASAGGVKEVTRLQQYIHLLKVAHARLLASLKTSGALPHTSDDPNLLGYENKDRRGTPTGNPPLLSSDSRSRSYGGTPNSEPAGNASFYEETLGDIRRLKSTRLDKHLSQTMSRTRSSRLIDGGTDSGAIDAQTGTKSQSGDRQDQGKEVSTVTLAYNSLALDDIPKIIAAKQAKDQRPNASKYARGHLIGGSEPKPRFVNGHKRDFSGDRDDIAGMALSGPGSRRFLSELSALEQFNVRHIAVLKLESLLDGQFNQEELLELIETRKATFWDRFGKKAFVPSKEKQKPTGKKKGVFGKPLEWVIEKDGAESTDGVGPGTLRVPALVQDAISAMRNMDMSVEGVFRKNGNIRRLNATAEEIDQKGCDGVDLNKETPVQVAALLKKFLRELPEPVMTCKLHRLFIAGARTSDDEKRRRIFHLTCCLMPKAHRDTMEVLFEFLKWAASFHTVDEESGSKMDIHNLATVMAPNILYSSNRAPDTDGSFLGIEAVNTIIECNSEMCQVPLDLQMMLGDSSIFSGSAELTTKEILKRYKDNEKAPQPNDFGTSSPSPVGNSASGRREPAQVSTDASTIQPEQSVRHVVDPSQGVASYGSSLNITPTNGSNTYALGVPNAPYSQAAYSSSDSINGNGANRNSRGPAVSKTPGQLGIP